MKKITGLLAVLLMVSGMNTVSAQTTTIILLRHAEKDTSTAGSTMMQSNPPLSREGEQRAAHIPELLKTYSPDAIFSTDYNRTRSTVAPLAKKFGRDIQVYDPRKLADLAKQLQDMPGKTIVVVGHSNTTPALVNLLIGENKYPNLDDSVYNQYWIVTISNGKAEARQLSY
ncbi:MAG: histidine phosphatase family protein [Chitinophagaceae bacterium]|nr:histidine phosphatase family protein [Chitinophagaceae bacterium]